MELFTTEDTDHTERGRPIFHRILRRLKRIGVEESSFWRQEPALPVGTASKLRRRSPRALPGRPFFCPLPGVTAENGLYPRL